jgi:D-amino-acid dehydrogenase
VLEIAEGLARLTERAEDDFRSLLQRAGLAAELVEAENLMVFDSRADLEHDRFAFELRERFGFGHELLGREELKRLEPDLGGPIACGVLLKRWLHFREPYRLAVALADYFRRRGGRLRIDGVARIRTEAGRAHALVLDSGETLPVRALVVAAGAWSRSLARDLGLRLPLAALQGYHYQVREPRVHLTRAVLYANGGFVLTPLATGLRIGGTIEVSGVDAKPNVRRAKVIAAKAKTILPALDLAGGETWMGPRPFMPDTLPVIGKAPAHPNVVLAFGHGQLGVTLAVTTGKLVADLVAGRPPAIDLTPYRPDRF